MARPRSAGEVADDGKDTPAVLTAGREQELAVDAPDVPGNGLLGETEPSGDGGIGPAFRGPSTAVDDHSRLAGHSLQLMQLRTPALTPIAERGRRSGGEAQVAAVPCGLGFKIK
jgi:hypothetical protein